MAHSMTPNTDYEIVTLKIAVPIGNWETSDALNEMLRPLAIEGIIADYDLQGMRDVCTRRTGIEVEEGDLFVNTSQKTL